MAATSSVAQTSIQKEVSDTKEEVKIVKKILTNSSSTCATINTKLPPLPVHSEEELAAREDILNDDLEARNLDQQTYQLRGNSTPQYSK